MALADDLVALASLAGKTVVAAAATDAWETVRHGIAQLFGRGGKRQTELAESRLAETRGQLAGVSGAELEAARVELAQRWAGRLADLLEEDPAAADGLRVVVSQVQSLLRAGAFAAGHSAAAGRDMRISASGSGVAAGVMDSPVIAGPGGTAIGRYEAAPRREAATLPVSLPPRPAPLAGRDDLLARLHALLTAGDQPRTVVLCGLGGVGKTSVAAEYAHRHLGGFGVAWQVAADDPAVAAAEMAELAAQLGARELGDPRDPVASVHAALAAYSAQWLLVFDNAPDEASVRRFLPPAGPGRVLITSQSALWPAGQVQLLEVPVLDTATGAGFLMNRTGDLDEAAAAELAAQLGGLPLALAQAAAYIQAIGSTLAGYLGLFRQRRADLVARGQTAGHPASVAATLALALSRLDAEAPDAAGLLRLLACLAPEPVPLGLLLASADAAQAPGGDAAGALGRLAGDPVAAGDAVAALRRYSLVIPAGDGSVSVHRLVQAVTADQMMPADAVSQWRQAAAAVIEAAIPDDTDAPETWTVCATLFPHAQAALADDSAGMARLANYLGHSGSYAAAVQLQRRIADAYDQVLGPEHPDTLSARNSLAYWTGEAGDAVGARDQFAALLPVTDRVLGPEHPETLTTRRGLAAYTGVTGDAAGARDQFAALQPVRERVSGPEHPDVLDARGNLAYWTGLAGDPAEARDQYAALLRHVEPIFSPEHPDFLDVRGNLADFTGRAGDAAGARDQYAALLPVMERVIGPEHPETLIAAGGLAHWTGRAGDAARARDQLAALLPKMERILGPQHPHTLSSQANLAYWAAQAGRGNPAQPGS